MKKNVTVRYGYNNSYNHDKYYPLRNLPSINDSQFTTVVTKHNVTVFENYYKEFFNFTKLIPCEIFNGYNWCLKIVTNYTNSTYSDAHYYYNPNIKLVNYTYTTYYRTYYEIYYDKYYNGSDIINITKNNETTNYYQTFYIDDVPENSSMNNSLLYLTS